MHSFTRRLSTAQLDYERRVLTDPHWKRMKNKAYYELKDYKCSLCGVRKGLEWHHLTYKRVGKNSEWKDIKLVCHRCHKACHYLVWVVRLPLLKRYLLWRYCDLWIHKRLSSFTLQALYVCLARQRR